MHREKRDFRKLERPRVARDSNIPQSGSAAHGEYCFRPASECAVRVSEARFKAMFNAAMDAIITVGPYGTVEDANPAAERLFGYSHSSLCGLQIDLLVPPDEVGDQVWSLARSPIAQLADARWNTRARRSDGKAFPVELSVRDLTIREGRLLAVIIRDLSEARKMERLKSAFVATVSHELRTPLTSIRGALGLLAGGVCGALPDSASEMLQIAISNSERLVNLVNDILDAEKLETSGMQLLPSPVEFRSAVARAVQANATFSGTRRARFVFIERAGPARALVDEQRLAQVVTNLLSNAVKFSPSDQAIEVTVSSERALVRLEVRDRGPGIPEEFRPRIFQRFAQADSSDSRLRGGTGLGLSIAKDLVERMNGQIGFRAAEPVGTVFYVEFPEFVEDQRGPSVSRP